MAAAAKGCSRGQRCPAPMLTAPSGSSALRAARSPGTSVTVKMPSPPGRGSVLISTRVRLKVGVSARVRVEVRASTIAVGGGDGRRVVSTTRDLGVAQLDEPWPRRLLGGEINGCGHRRRLSSVLERWWSVQRSVLDGCLSGGVFDANAWGHRRTCVCLPGALIMLTRWAYLILS